MPKKKAPNEKAPMRKRTVDEKKTADARKSSLHKRKGTLCKKALELDVKTGCRTIVLVVDEQNNRLHTYDSRGNYADFVKNTYGTFRGKDVDMTVDFPTKKSASSKPVEGNMTEESSGYAGSEGRDSVSPPSSSSVAEQAPSAGASSHTAPAVALTSLAPVATPSPLVSAIAASLSLGDQFEYPFSNSLQQLPYDHSYYMPNDMAPTQPIEVDESGCSFNYLSDLAAL